MTLLFDYLFPKGNIIEVDSNRYDIVVIDSNVVLIEKITRIVQDIIYD